MPYMAMIIVWATAGVAWMERSLRSVIQVLLAEMMIMAPYITRLERRAIERGLQQGPLEGRQEGESLVLRRLLTRRFGSLPAWVEQRLEQASPAELEQWVERVLDARTLEEVFQSLA